MRNLRVLMVQVLESAMMKVEFFFRTNPCPRRALRTCQKVVKVNGCDSGEMGPSPVRCRDQDSSDPFWTSQARRTDGGLFHVTLQ